MVIFTLVPSGGTRLYQGSVTVADCLASLLLLSLLIPANRSHMPLNSYLSQLRHTALPHHPRDHYRSPFFLDPWPQPVVLSVPWIRRIDVVRMVDRVIVRVRVYEHPASSTCSSLDLKSQTCSPLRP